MVSSKQTFGPPQSYREGRTRAVTTESYLQLAIIRCDKAFTFFFFFLPGNQAETARCNQRKRSRDDVSRTFLQGSGVRALQTRYNKHFRRVVLFFLYNCVVSA